MARSKVVGVFEAVNFPSFSDADVIAKLDTGAYSGAIHCSRIKQLSRESGPGLEFYPLNSDEPVIFEEFAVRYVKSSNGDKKKRYFVETEIKIAGRTYPIVLSLTDRTDMKWQVLIGRKFLKQHGFIVDARKPSRYGKSG